MTEKLYYTWENLASDVDALVQQVKDSDFVPTKIVGIVRGGMIPAVIMSHKLNIPVVSLQWSKRDFAHQQYGKFLENIVRSAISDNQRYLIVDDILDSGETFADLKRWTAMISDTSLLKNKIKYATLIRNTSSEVHVDFHSTEIDRKVDDRWLVFPWE